MSLQAKILSLIADITDPAMRIDIASTINYIFSLYTTGHFKDDEIRNALRDIIRDVIAIVHPELTDEEIRKKTKDLVEDFMRAFRVESARRRLFATLGKLVRSPY